MATKEIRIFTKGDTLVQLYAHLRKADGSTPALSGTVAFFMKGKTASALKVNGGACLIVNAAARTVRYPWADADVNTAGDYYGWFVNTDGGKGEHFPGQGKLLTIKIVEAE